MNDPLPTGVILIEDEPNAMHRCIQVVEMHPRLRLVDTASTFRDGCNLLDRRAGEAGLLLTDLRLGDGHGSDLIEKWRELGGEFAMVVTVFGDVDSVMRAVSAGADGYLLKSGSDYEMMTAVTTVLDGGSPISASVAGHLLRRIRMDAASASQDSELASPEPALSVRETEILGDLARGLSYKEVARFRSISPYTVADHVKAIYRKLAVSSRGEAVFKGIKDGIIDVSKDE